MADKKITALTALVGADVADTDVFAVVDVSATETKKITASELAVAIAEQGLNAGGASRVHIHGVYLPATHNIEFEGTTNNDHETILTVVDPTADRTLSLPNETGTLATQAYADSAASTAAGAVSLDNLSDVTITSVSSGQLLSYNGSAWVNSAPVAAFNPVEAMVFM
jgi:hypothetical protein